MRPKAGGQGKAEFSFEVARPFLRVTGEPVSDLFLVDAWGPLGKWAVENVRTGSRLVVIGTLNKESYMTRGGREHLTVIKAKGLKLLDGKVNNLELNSEDIKADCWSKETLVAAVEKIRQIVNS